MVIYNPFSAEPPTLLTKVMEIGVWNMAVTETVQIAHGLTVADIRTVNAMINNDTGSSAFPLKYSPVPTETAGDVYCSSTNAVCTRFPLGFFDTTTFDDAVMNRGFIIIQYVP